MHATRETSNPGRGTRPAYIPAPWMTTGCAPRQWNRGVYRIPHEEKVEPHAAGEGRREARHHATPQPCVQAACDVRLHGCQRHAFMTHSPTGMTGRKGMDARPRMGTPHGNHENGGLWMAGRRCQGRVRRKGRIPATAFGILCGGVGEEEEKRRSRAPGWLVGLSRPTTGREGKAARGGSPVHLDFFWGGKPSGHCSLCSDLATAGAAHDMACGRFPGTVP